MKRIDSSQTPRYARLLLRLTHWFPNFDMAFIRPLRARATRALRLGAGDRVLDVGCGIGGSFPFLADAVGPTGEVLGVEISGVSAARARHRIAVNRWRHVSVVQSPAQSVRLDGTFDGLVMFAAPDVYASADALRRILPHLRTGARIVLFGAKTTNGVAGAVLNPLLRYAVSRWSFATTPHPDADPWRLVAAATDRLDIHPAFFGAMFLATGSLKESWAVDLERAITVEEDRHPDRGGATRSASVWPLAQSQTGSLDASTATQLRMLQP